MKTITFKASKVNTSITHVATTTKGRVVIGCENGEIVTWWFEDMATPKTFYRNSPDKKVIAEKVAYIGFSEENIAFMAWQMRDNRTRLRRLRAYKNYLEETIALAPPLTATDKIISITANTNLFIYRSADFAGNTHIRIYNSIYKKAFKFSNISTAIYFNGTTYELIAIKNKNIIVLGQYSIFDRGIQSYREHTITNSDYLVEGMHSISNIYLSNNNKFLLVVENDQSMIALYHINDKAIAYLASFSLKTLKLAEGVTLNHCALYEDTDLGTIIISAVFSNGTILLWSVTRIGIAPVQQHHHFAPLNEGEPLHSSAFLSPKPDGRQEYVIVVGANSSVYYIQWTECLRTQTGEGPIAELHNRAKRQRLIRTQPRIYTAPKE